jgi:hypothetical protein
LRIEKYEVRPQFSSSAVQQFSSSAVQQFSSSAVQQFSSSAVQQTLWRICAKASSLVSFCVSLVVCSAFQFNLSTVAHAQGLLNESRMGEELKMHVRNRAENIVNTWAYKCNTPEDFAQVLSGFPSKEKSSEVPQKDGSRLKISKCNVDDFVLFNGLLCFAGEAKSCSYVKMSQGKAGEMYRSPVHKDVDAKNSFSRDHILGTIMYLLGTKDRQLATQYQLFLESRRSVACAVKGLSECTPSNKYQGLEIILGSACSNANDSKCAVMPAVWDLMYYVSMYIGVPPSPSSIFWHELLNFQVPDGDWNQVKNSVLDVNFKGGFRKGIYSIGDAFAEFATETTRFTTLRTLYLRNAAMNPSTSGYELHLKSIQGLAYQALDQQEIGSEILKQAHRNDPAHPLFDLLHNGASDEWAQKFDSVCPSSPFLPGDKENRSPKRIKWFLEEDSGKKFNEYGGDKGKLESFATEFATGWECRLMQLLSERRLPIVRFPFQTECKIPVYSSGRELTYQLTCSSTTRKVVNLLLKETPEKAAVGSCYAAVGASQAANSACQVGEKIIQYAPTVACTVPKVTSWTVGTLTQFSVWTVVSVSRLVDVACQGWREVKTQVCSTVRDWFGNWAGSVCDTVSRWEPIQLVCKANRWVKETVETKGTKWVYEVRSSVNATLKTHNFANLKAQIFAKKLRFY